MPAAPLEFHYRLPQRAPGWRPGAHGGTGLGAGQAFVGHRRLFDWPDPRRLDVRASLHAPDGDWLVRVHRPRVAVTVQAVVDVSASMRFGAPRRKLDVAADFVRALGWSAFRTGDAAGLMAFDARLRRDLLMPARHGRGLGPAMAERLLRGGESPRAGSIAGLQEAARHLAARAGFVFIVSDFHWPLERLASVLDLLRPAVVVPLVVWDAAEIEPPALDGLLMLQDSESARHRTLWMRAGLRRAWREAAAQRRETLVQALSAGGVPPLFLAGAFDADALSRHLMEHAA